MGTWGVKLYNDDVAEEVRDAYKKLIGEGKTGVEATQEVLEDFVCFASDDDDAPVFWFALADTQWNIGRLEENVKREALRHIEDGDNLRRWQNENPKQAKARETVLENLRQKLLSPQPPKKKLRIKKPYKCEWEIGDVYAYLLENDYAKEKGLDGRYLLLHKVFNHECLGDVIPIVRVKITEGNELPQSEAEIEKLEYVQMHHANPSRDEDINLKSRMNYVIYLSNTSKRAIPKKLIYIGNYQNISPPENEYIPKNLVFAWGSLWKWFETSIVKRYLFYNKGRKGISFVNGEEDKE